MHELLYVDPFSHTKNPFRSPFFAKHCDRIVHELFYMAPFSHTQKKIQLVFLFTPDNVIALCTNFSMWLFLVTPKNPTGNLLFYTRHCNRFVHELIYVIAFSHTKIFNSKSILRQTLWSHCTRIIAKDFYGDMRCLRNELKVRIEDVLTLVFVQIMLLNIWHEMNYHMDVFSVTKRGHIEEL